MAKESRDELGVELSGLLGDIDAAIAARFQEPQRYERRRRRPPRLRGVVAAAFRWFGRAPRKALAKAPKPS